MPVLDFLCRYSHGKFENFIAQLFVIFITNQTTNRTYLCRSEVIELGYYQESSKKVIETNFYTSKNNKIDFPSQ